MIGDMCGQFGQEDLTWVEIYNIQRRFLDAGIMPKETIRPTDQAWTIARDREGLLMQAARFWLVPEWHKGTIKDWKATTFNARIEDIENKPSFRGGWKYRRILVPASHYIEWTGEKGKKLPWRIRTNSNQASFMMAGIASYWQDIPSFALITRAANDSIMHIHPRMPVILNEDEIRCFLHYDNDKSFGESTELFAKPV